MFPDFNTSLMGTTAMPGAMAGIGGIPLTGMGEGGGYGGMGGVAPPISGSVGGGFFGGASPVSAGLAGLQTLGALWGAWQQNKMAKKQFKFTKDITNTNLANQIKSYNTALYDRARSRAVMESQSDAERDAYINNNSLSRSATGSHKTDAYTHNYGNTVGGAPVLAGSAGSSSSSSLNSIGSSLASRASAARGSSRDDEATRH